MQQLFHFPNEVTHKKIIFRSPIMDIFQLGLKLISQLQLYQEPIV